MEKDINTLVQENEKLVYAVYNSLGVNYYIKREEKDLISVGLYGLWRGLESYDKTNGVKLSTYLYTCIKNEMLMYLRSLSTNKNMLFENTLSLDYVSEDLESGRTTRMGNFLAYDYNYYKLDIKEYVDIYFRYNANTKIAVSRVPAIVKYLALGYNIQEIADLLEVSRQSVHRYIAKLRKALKTQEKFDNREV